MTNEEIKKNNKLIAHFMGAKMIVENYHGINIMEFPDGTTADFFGLKYHKSWDWLMPVVQKINTSKKIYSFCNKHFVISDEGELFIPSHIDDVYTAIVEFIKWYNGANNV